MSYKYSNAREYQGKLLLEDRKNQNYLEINSSGLVLIDGATKQKCTLKFENGVLKINGKEIATVENS